MTGEFISRSEEETELLGERLAEALKRGDVVALWGGLGAGKTAFVRGAVRGLGVHGVSSPTFALMNVYGDSIYHMDAYRLGGEDEAEEAGLADYIGDGICFVEWPERVEGLLPEGYISVRIENAGDDVRRITVSREGGK